MDLDPATAKSHVLVSRAKMAALSGSAGTETDRDHRERYKMASYLWAPDSAHLLFDANGRLWLLRPEDRNGRGGGIHGTGFRRRSQVFARTETWFRLCAIMACRSCASRRSGSPALMVATPPQCQTDDLTAKSIGFTKKSSMCAAIISGRPTRRAFAYLQMNETSGTGVSDHRLDADARAGGYAALSAARRPESGCAHRSGVGAGGGKMMWVRLPYKGGEDYIPRFGWVDRRRCGWKP